MIRKFSLAALAAAATLALPAAADAHPNGRAYGYWNNSAHARGYQDRYADRYYDRGAQQDGYYRDRAYRDYDDGYARRCSGTTGTVVGGVAGALLGRTVTRDGGRHSGTTGTILGGALGALAGRAVDKSSCRNR